MKLIERAAEHAVVHDASVAHAHEVELLVALFALAVRFVYEPGVRKRDASVLRSRVRFLLVLAFRVARARVLSRVVTGVPDPSEAREVVGATTSEANRHQRGDQGEVNHHGHFLP